MYAESGQTIAPRATLLARVGTYTEHHLGLWRRRVETTHTGLSLMVYHGEDLDALAERVQVQVTFDPQMQARSLCTTTSKRRIPVYH
jgi:hypothetical protein